MIGRQQPTSPSISNDENLLDGDVPDSEGYYSNVANLAYWKDSSSTIVAVNKISK